MNKNLKTDLESKIDNEDKCRVLSPAKHWEQVLYMHNLADYTAR